MKKTGNSLRKALTLQASPELIEIQAFMPIDPADKDRLRKDIEKHGIRDPLKVYHKDGQYYILGGYNRREIALELGIDLVPIDIYEGTPQERRELVINDNLSRRHLTAEQKRDLIRYFLKNDPGQSDRIVGKKTGTHHSTVSKERAALVRRGEISHVEKRTDTRGRKQPATRQAAPQRSPRVPVSSIKNQIKQYLSEQKNPKQAARDLIEYIKSLK